MEDKKRFKRVQIFVYGIDEIALNLPTSWNKSFTTALPFLKPFINLKTLKSQDKSGGNDFNYIKSDIHL